MIRIDLSDSGLIINEIPVSFPIRTLALIELLGQPVSAEGPYNRFYTWHDLGLRAFCLKDNSDLIETIEIVYHIANTENITKNSFMGQLVLNNHTVDDLQGYYTQNKNKRVKLWETDTNGAFVFSNVSLWFNIVKQQIYGLSIQAYEPVQEVVHESLPIDEQHQDLIQIWQQWKAAITQRVGPDNAYYNPTHGITKQDIESLESKFEHLGKLPSELENFYKISNVRYNTVTSILSFQIHNWTYELIPFQDIATHWQEIQDLEVDPEDLDQELTDLYDSRIKCKGYANSKWIPFAESKNGDYLVIDTDPSPKGTYGQIIELQNESFSRVVVAQTLKELVLKEIDSLHKPPTEHIQFVIDHGTF